MEVWILQFCKKIKSLLTKMSKRYSANSVKSGSDLPVFMKIQKRDGITKINWGLKSRGKPLAEIPLCLVL